MAGRFRDKFCLETCTVIAKTETTFRGGAKFLDKNYGLLGHKSLILSGSHGGPAGEDGVVNISCLDSLGKKMINGKYQLNPEETRKFYIEWLELFLKCKVEADDTDPRIYKNEDHTEVEGIKKEEPPKWKTVSREFDGIRIDFQV